jgi:hypothetical protein
VSSIKKPSFFFVPSTWQAFAEIFSAIMFFFAFFWAFFHSSLSPVFNLGGV